MPRAQLQHNKLSLSAVDEASGVISGVKLMEAGKTATFKDASGKARSFEVTPELISGLLAHAGNRSIPAHFTHDWTNGEKDALHARLGVHKNIRVDEDGDLVSDLHTMPNEYGKLAIWTAKNDPTSAMLSAIFDYNEIQSGGKTFAVPLNFQAADLVAQGAATTALLSKANPTDTDMTKEEIQALINEGVTAALAKFTPAGFVTKEDSDKAITAALAAHNPKVSEDESKRIALLAKAEVVSEIGKSGFIASTGKKESDDAESFITAQLSAGCKNRGAAILRLAHDKPEIYNAAVSAGKL